MKIIHTADLHLDSAIKGLSEQKSKERRREILKTFGRIIDTAKSVNADAVLIAGDLFDKERVTRDTGEYVVSHIEKAAPIKFYYLRGNHDECTPFDENDIPSNLTIMGDGCDCVPLSDNISLYAFDGAEKFDTAEFDRSKKNIVMYHGEIVPIVGKLAGKYIDYLALGHYHKHDEGKIDNRGIWLYPGCPNGRGYDECGEKGVEIIETDGTALKHSFEATADRIYHEIEIETSRFEKTADLADSVSEKTKNIKDGDLVKIVLTGSKKENIRHDSADVTEKLDRFFGHKIVDNTEIATDNLGGSLSLAGKFAELVEGDSSLTDGMKRLVLQCGLDALKNG